MIRHRLGKCFVLELEYQDDRDQDKLLSEPNKMFLSWRGTTIMLKADALNTLKCLHYSLELIKSSLVTDFTFAT
jgi:hypothetical protein